jgi:hypothetical protein
MIRDTAHLRRAFALAAEARARGDRPCAAVIVAEDGTTLAEGSRPPGQRRRRDAGAFRDERLSIGDLCRNPAGAAAAGDDLFLRRGLRDVRRGDLLHRDRPRGARPLVRRHPASAQPHTAGLSLSCRAVLASAAERVEVAGPCLEEEGAVPHRGYSTTGAA